MFCLNSFEVSLFIMKKPLLLFFCFIILASSSFAQTAQSLHFDGTDDYVDIGKPIFDVNNKNTPYTIEAWIKTASGNDDCIVCQYTFPGDYRFQFETRGDKLNWWKGVAGIPSNQISIVSNQSITDNMWHHVAGTVDASGIVKLFIDGVQDGSGIDTFRYNNINTIIGQRLNNSSNPGNFNGNMDEVRIWRTARTANQIMDNMCPGEEFDTTGLIAYYKFNQGIASSNNSSINTVQDETVNMNNGMMNGFGLSGSTSNWVGLTPCFPVSTRDLESNQNLSIWPNPTHGFLQFKGLKSGSASIFDLQGRKILQRDIINSSLDVSELKAGMFFIQIYYSNSTYFAKFILDK